MSASSSASGSVSHGGEDEGGYDGQDSPVPYRVGPLAYKPDVACGCQRKACRYISWSNDHPGERYLRCSRARTRLDCNFLRWVDEPCSEWFQGLLRDLRDAVWQLKKTLGRKEAELQAKNLQLVAKQIELEEKEKEVEDKNMQLVAKQQELDAKQEELRAKQVQLEAKQQQLESMDLVVQALDAKLELNGQYIQALVYVCFGLVFVLVVVLMNAK